MQKLIVLGPPLTGKTTLAKQLQTRTSIPVLDFDDELKKRNHGKYPAHYPDLNEKLKAAVIADVLTRDEVIFFAFEIPVPDLQKLRRDGFVIAQLKADMDTLRQRNEKRLREEPDNDAFRYVEKNLKYQSEIKDIGLIDVTVNSVQPIDRVREEIEYLIT